MKIIKILLLCTICVSSAFSQLSPSTEPSGDTVIIHMAALDQPFMYNRLGTSQPTGMIFALERDIIAKDGLAKSPGNVQLRPGKRPRPIVLRANVGDIIAIHFTNYLRPYKASEEVEFYEGFPTKQEDVNSIYPATRHAGVHIIGTELATSIGDDASFVGANESSLAAPGEQKTYMLYAPAEGTFVLHSTADNIADGTIRAGQISNGLFGSLIVEPPQAEWYRSQVTEEELFDATLYWAELVDYATGEKKITQKPTNVTQSFRQKNKGFPIIDYNAMTYDTRLKDSVPILKMYKQIRTHARELIATDLTAVVTGPNAGNFPLYDESPSFFNVPASPDRREPFREFSIHYHEAPYAVQAFPEFYNNISDTIRNITQTIQGGVDQFAFNYGTGGIGAEIYANRVNIGPMADCIDCAYEEFFLSAWAVSDPAQVVDIPANVQSPTEDNTPVERLIDSTLQDLMLRDAVLLAGGGQTLDATNLDTVLKATKVLYPDDPSNVYHSYMNDHVKFRINHCGAGITHVHHQHAHQWLHSPNSDKGHYLDSQTINPGASYTLEMVHDGSGNLNKTVGDQIFHCHFYPHFAQGMWAMWRVHDVLETGTVMNEDGTVAVNSRALPDGEIDTGTPIPGIVPISTLPMAPIGGPVKIEDGQIVLEDEGISPGYPFYIPGVAGQRAPHPPLDFAKGDVWTVDSVEIKNTELNGGLPRNVLIDGVVLFENHTRYDWTKITDSLHAVLLPEEGTYYEKLAMAAHATRVHNTLTPDSRPGNFILNGLPPVSGAPYADPAIDANGYAVGKLRRYKAANIQVDAVVNELGWHYPQQRPIVLWGDVAATIAGERPPEPFFMRANSGEYIEYWHTNLVPEYYELDDYQVRTPTDIIGQHIHLVKFDVTSSDGAANGWNYEDGTLSPGLVTEHIKEINNGKLYAPNLGEAFNTSIIESAADTTIVEEDLVPYLPMKIWGETPSDQSWIGAQTTIQRWYSDPLFDNEGEDRTLRTVFTHDHFGPSTHQQVGLYAGLLIEPAGSSWLNSSTGKPLGFAQLDKTRDIPTKFIKNANGAPISGTDLMAIDDGGPTDWQAIIQTGNEEDAYREFMFEFQDNTQAYLPGSKGSIVPYPEFYPGKVNNYTFADSVNLTYRGWIQPTMAINPPASPELVSTGNRGFLSVNYRNSPVPIRVAPGGGKNASDLAYAFSSTLDRGVDALNSQPTPGYIDKSKNDFIWPAKPLTPGMLPGDPYTPLARAYQGDKIQVRTLVGAHVNPHFFNIHGVKWYFEPSFENSGFRSTQMMSISEHFEMNFQLPFTEGKTADYLYQTNADDTGLQGGSWGLMRSHQEKQPDLVELPNNKLKDDIVVKPENNGSGCPADAPIRKFDVTAISIDKYQQGGPNWGVLVYNKTNRNFDSKAMVFVKTEELEAFKHNPNYEPKPLVLRANAGECIDVTLRNEITPEFVNNTGTITYATQTVSDTTGTGKKQKITTSSPNIFNYETSYTVGLHAELLSYDVTTSDGTSVGVNPAAGQLLPNGDGNGKNTVNYQWYAGQWNSDGQNFTPEPVEFGTVVLTAPDPLLQYVSGLFGALIIEPEGTYWVEDQNNPTSANIFAMDSTFLFREFVLMFQDNIQVASEPIGSITGETTQGGLNYKSEPLANRVFFNSQGTNNFNDVDVSAILSNSAVLAVPETPTFVAKAKSPVRFRVMYPGGVGDGTTFDLHGHVWQEEPYTDHSTKLGFNPKSQWLGARGQLGALNSFDLLINSAGGRQGVTGDYLYRDYRNQTFQNGIWGLFKVSSGMDVPTLARIQTSADSAAVLSGVNTVNPTNGKYAASVVLSTGDIVLGATDVNQWNGNWMIELNDFTTAGGLTISSILDDGSNGGSITYTAEQLEQFFDPLITRVRMKQVKRSDAKKIEPGSNDGHFLESQRD